MSKKTKRELDRIAKRYDLRKIVKPKNEGERWKMDLCLGLNIHDDLLADLDKPSYKKFVVILFANTCKDAVMEKLKIKRL